MNDLESTVRSRLHDLADEAPDDGAADNARTARLRYHRQRRNRVVVLATCAALVVIGVGSAALGTVLGSADGTVATRPDGDVTTAPPAPTSAGPSAAPTETASAPPPTPLVTSSTPAPSAGSTATTGTGSAPSAPPPPPQSPAWPDEAMAVHGGTYWSVVLELVRDDEEQDAAQAALDALQELGYQGGIGDVGCTDGIRQALGLDPAHGYTNVDVLFATAEEAQRFVDLYQPGVVGTVRVTTYCLD